MSDKNIEQPFLTHVLKALTELKETRGSIFSKIVDHVQRGMEDDFKLRRTRNVTCNIRRALEHAVETGLAEQLHGKYKLSLKEPPSKTTNKPKTNPKRRDVQPVRIKNKKPPLKAFGKGHKKKIRRVGLVHNDDDGYTSFSSRLTDTSVQSLSSSDSQMQDMPEFASFKRRRRSSKTRTQKGRSKKRQQKSTPEPSPPPALETKVNEFTDEPVAKRLYQGSKNNLNGSSKTNATAAPPKATEKPAPECDNIDCLCNLKKKHEDDPPEAVTAPAEPTAAKPKKTP